MDTLLLPNASRRIFESFSFCASVNRVIAGLADSPEKLEPFEDGWWATHPPTTAWWWGVEGTLVGGRIIPREGRVFSSPSV